MDILLIHQYFVEKEGSGGSRFNEMTRRWVEQGHRVTVVAGMVNYTTGKKEKKYKGKFITSDEYQPGLKVYRCHVSESYNTNFPGRLWGYFSFVFSSLICCFFSIRKRPDLVLATSPPLFVGITALMVSWLKRVPMVFEVRDLWPESAIDTGVLRSNVLIKLSYAFERLVYRNAGRINTLTPAFRKKLVEEKGIPAEKVLMIPNAADFSLAESIMDEFDRETFRKQLGLNGEFVVTYVGAHGVANHLIQMIEAAERLKGQDVIIMLVGDGMQKEYLQKEAKKRDLDNVRFVDSVPKEDVFKYILASDMGASVLKRADTFKTVWSNKTFDYMSCRKPVLMVIDGVSRELVEEAGCGVFAEPENPRDIAEKVGQYAADPQKAREEGENGYRYAQQHFDRIRLADQYLEELKNVART